jgi:hypothetical protein
MTRLDEDRRHPLSVLADNPDGCSRAIAELVSALPKPVRISKRRYGARAAAMRWAFSPAIRTAPAAALPVRWKSLNNGSLRQRESGRSHSLDDAKAASPVKDGAIIRALLAVEPDGAP